MSQNSVTLIPKFKPLYTSTDSRYFVLTGGRGSAKSFHICTFLVQLTYEQDHVILFTRYTMISAHISIIPEFLEKIELLGVKDHFDITKTEITNKFTGSKIIFRGLRTSSGDQTASLKSIQGVTTFVLDEAEELVDENKFDVIDESVRKKGVQNRCILIMNPSTREHWVYKRFFEDRGVQEGSNVIHEDTTYIHTTYLDNLENLSESFIKKFERLKKTHPDKYNHRVLGGWLVRAEGVIFTNWKFGDFQDVGQVIYGQDYGYSPDPTTLVKVSIDEKRKRIYVKECFYEEEKSTEEIINLNKEYAKKELIIADSAEKRLIEDIRKKGLNIKPCIKGEGSIKAGINKLLEYEWIVDHASVNIAKELNNYVYSDKKTQVAIDEYNHCIDAIRYVVYWQSKKQKRRGAWVSN